MIWAHGLPSLCRFLTEVLSNCSSRLSWDRMGWGRTGSPEKVEASKVGLSETSQRLG